MKQPRMGQRSEKSDLYLTAKWAIVCRSNTACGAETLPLSKSSENFLRGMKRILSLKLNWTRHIGLCFFHFDTIWILRDVWRMRYTLGLSSKGQSYLKNTLRWEVQNKSLLGACVFCKRRLVLKHFAGDCGFRSHTCLFTAITIFDYPVFVEATQNPIDQSKCNLLFSWFVKHILLPNLPFVSNQYQWWLFALFPSFANLTQISHICLLSVLWTVYTQQPQNITERTECVHDWKIKQRSDN